MISCPSDALFNGSWSKTSDNRAGSESIVTNTTDISQGGSDTQSDNVAVVSQELRKDLSLEYVTMTDVEVSDEPTKPYQKWNKKTKQETDPKICSKLVSIAGIDPVLMTVQDLQKFCTWEKIKLGRNPNKGHLCHQIAEEKINPTKKEAPPKKQNPVN